MGKLEKMTIIPCAIDDQGNLTAKGKAKGMKVMINPKSFKQNHSITYSTKNPQGDIGSDQKFIQIVPEQVSFDLVFDSTGVVPDALGKVKDRLKQLRKITYHYEGKEHQPPPVKLTWGTFLFYGRLTKMDVEYTLFKPSGEPLRAKTQLTFKEYMSRKEQAAKQKNSSPDLTHTVVVKAGDTLPLLCNQIYKDPSYYPAVAQVNGLNTLTVLHPGQRLKFPPLQ